MPTVPGSRLRPLQPCPERPSPERVLPPQAGRPGNPTSAAEQADPPRRVLRVPGAARRRGMASRRAGGPRGRREHSASRPRRARALLPHRREGRASSGRPSSPGTTRTPRARAPPACSIGGGTRQVRFAATRRAPPREFARYRLASERLLRPAAMCTLTSMAERTKLGERIRTARTERGWKQKHLAASVSVEPITVSRWERGATTPDLDALGLVAEATGKPVSYFVDQTRSRGGSPRARRSNRSNRGRRGADRRGRRAPERRRR